MGVKPINNHIHQPLIMDLLPSADKQEPIAIVGVAFRFAAGASSMGSLWDMISKVKTGHGPVPSDRWDSKMWHHPDQDRKGGISPQHGYFLEQDISHFDAPFFSVTAKEASSMDPMKRMLLEVCYESIENGRCSESSTLVKPDFD